MAYLRIRDFPDDLRDEAKDEASTDGDTFRALVLEAIQREVVRRRAVPADVRNRRRAELRAARREAERARQRAEGAE